MKVETDCVKNDAGWWAEGFCASKSESQGLCSFIPSNCSDYSAKDIHNARLGGSCVVLSILFWMEGFLVKSFVYI